MPESKRLESLPTGDTVAPADRDARVEALLIEGLDRYFSGRYDDAIHLWTRVLFLDRSHARARAYIDRARTALAERQRRGEEMLHRSDAMIQQGEADRARDLLTEAVAASGEDERAADVRARLERLERAHLAARTPVATTAAGRWYWLATSSTWSLAYQQRSTVLVLVAAAVVLALAISSPAVRDIVGLGAPAEDIVAPQPGAAPEALSSAEVALVRARTLYTRGRLAEALRALDRVDADSSTRAAADELRIEIQRLLLASGREVAPGEPGPGTGRP